MFKRFSAKSFLGNNFLFSEQRGLQASGYKMAFSTQCFDRSKGGKTLMYLVACPCNTSAEPLGAKYQWSKGVFTTGSRCFSWPGNAADFASCCPFDHLWNKQGL